MMITWRFSLLVLLFAGFKSRTLDQLHEDGNNIRFDRIMTKNELQNFSVTHLPNNIHTRTESQQVTLFKSSSS